MPGSFFEQQAAFWHVLYVQGNAVTWNSQHSPKNISMVRYQVTVGNSVRKKCCCKRGNGEFIMRIFCLTSRALLATLIVTLRTYILLSNQ